MPDREKVIETCEKCIDSGTPAMDYHFYYGVLALLKEQETILQTMWNALYAEEDKLESKYVGTDEHDKWFLVYRPWLLLGFGIAINVISKQEERRDDNA